MADSGNWPRCARRKTATQNMKMTVFSRRLFLSLIPRKARPFNTIPHPLSATRASPSLWLGAAAVTLAAACADLQWHKAGASAQALEQDLAECRGEARINAGPDSRSLGAGLPRVVGADAIGRPMMGTPGRLDSDRFLVEHDLTRICMQRRGYELVPAGKS